MEAAPHRGGDVPFTTGLRRTEGGNHRRSEAVVRGACFTAFPACQR